MLLHESESDHIYMWTNSLVAHAQGDKSYYHITSDDESSDKLAINIVTDSDMNNNHESLFANEYQDSITFRLSNLKLTILTQQHDSYFIYNYNYGRYDEYGGDNEYLYTFENIGFNLISSNNNNNNNACELLITHCV